MYYSRGGYWSDDLSQATMMRVEVAERLVRMKRMALTHQPDSTRWLYSLKVRRIFIGDLKPNAHLMEERRAEEAAVARVTVAMVRSPA